MPIQQTSYLMFTALQDAWSDLNSRVEGLNIPPDLWRSAQNPAAPFLKLYGDWDQRTSNIYDDQGRVVRPLSVSELEIWTTRLREQEPIVKALEATYGRTTAYGSKSTSSDSEAVRRFTPESELIVGQVPWLVRIAAGVGAGYLLYRMLRPRRKYA